MSSVRHRERPRLGFRVSASTSPWLCVRELRHPGSKWAVAAVVNERRRAGLLQRNGKGSSYGCSREGSSAQGIMPASRKGGLDRAARPTGRTRGRRGEVEAGRCRGGSLPCRKRGNVGIVIRGVGAAEVLWRRRRPPPPEPYLLDFPRVLRYGGADSSFFSSVLPSSPPWPSPHSCSGGEKGKTKI